MSWGPLAYTDRGPYIGLYRGGNIGIERSSLLHSQAIPPGRRQDNHWKSPHGLRRETKDREQVDGTRRPKQGTSELFDHPVVSVPEWLRKSICQANLQ